MKGEDVQVSEALTESHRYLATLDRRVRRSAGIVYTPDALVGLVLDQEFGAGGSPEGPTLDPACDAGQFTTALIARIAHALDEQGHDITSLNGRRLFLAEVERLVWACDIDAGAIAVALTEARTLIERLTPGPQCAV